MFRQSFSQADNGQHRRAIQGFGKRAGITHIQTVDLGFKIRVQHLTYADGPAGVGADERSHKDAGAFGTGLKKNFTANRVGVFQTPVVTGGQRFADFTVRIDAAGDVVF